MFVNEVDGAPGCVGYRHPFKEYPPLSLYQPLVIPQVMLQRSAPIQTGNQCKRLRYISTSL